MNLLGLDYGTTSLKSMLIREDGEVLFSASYDYTLRTDNNRVEFDAQEYFSLLRDAIREAERRFPVDALAVDTQCETLIVADENGVPLRNAIVWLDNRAVAQAEKIRERFGRQTVYEKTGQPEITPAWPAAKLLWIRENEPEVFRGIKKIFLLEDYLLFRLTGRFVTQRSLQSSTLYFDITNGRWWEEMLDYLGISQESLPVLLESGVRVGEYRGITVVTGAMDQAAGAIGVGVVEPGMVSEMTGTTLAVFAPIDHIPAYAGAETLPCHYLGEGRYGLLLWTPVAAMALQWFRDRFSEETSFEELDRLAAQIPAGACGVTFLPYLCGSFLPKYNPDARGCFYGITLEHTRAHFARAILESIACLLNHNLSLLPVPVRELRSTGGGAKSPLWCQIKVDLLNKKIVTLQNQESACLGAAVLAGIGTGVFGSLGEACDRLVIKKQAYLPSGESYTEAYRRYLWLDAQLNQGGK